MHCLSYWQSKPWRILVPTLAFLLVVTLACGAPAEQPGPGIDPADPSVIDSAPTSTPEVTADQSDVEATGTLNVGLAELGSFHSMPRMSDPSAGRLMAVTGYESLAYPDAEGDITPRLATEWSISEDGVLWTFHLQEGVQFHKGYGEMTSEDVIYSFRSAGAQDSIHSRGGQVAGWFRHPDGGVEVINDYTFQVNTGVPQFGIETSNLTAPTSRAVWVVSKSQADELGEETASRQGAGTGPWEIMDHSSELWRFRAVGDHWRKAPHFAELVLWNLPEESSRIAGFQTGMLDTTQMALESLPTVENVPGTKFLRMPNVGIMNLFLHGQTYIGIGTEHQRPGYDPNLPWVSADPDPASEEWARARMVREAMSLAIDRETIVDTLLRGEATPGPAPHPFLCCPERLSPRTYEYDPDRAQELLAEAGYPDGFEIALTATPRGIPADVESCEAIAEMWRQVGIRTNQQRVPYETIRPFLVSRRYQGALCQANPFPGTPTDSFIGGYRSASVWTAGMEHPWLEEQVEAAISTVADTEKREEIEDEVGRFLFDNFTHLGVYAPNVLFPLGPKVDEWPLAVWLERGVPNNFEYARPRQ